MATATAMPDGDSVLVGVVDRLVRLDILTGCLQAQRGGSISARSTWKISR